MLKKIILFFTVLLFTFSLNAQCAMCRAQLENMGNQSLAEGINEGIVYLMAIPYILLAAVAYILYRGYKKKYAENKL